jgi:hypothetical protein
MARNVNMGAHPYNDMKIGVPTRDKIDLKLLGKLDKEYARLLTKGTKKQQEQYLRSVYYKVA